MGGGVFVKSQRTRTEHGFDTRTDDGLSWLSLLLPSCENEVGLDSLQFFRIEGGTIPNSWTDRVADPHLIILNCEQGAYTL